MITSIPVVLEGMNLGERHQHFNTIVNSAFQQQINLKSILQIGEKSAIDRIYKIDLASKYRDVEYILNNLKDNDMLYVSRALKSHWLLEPRYCDIINPRHLEEMIFPQMIQPAVNKMRHWLQINLNDTTRCQEFYEYYKDQHEIAIKFFRHCSQEFILSEMLNILDKLTPRDLKIICENCPQAAKVYLESLHSNKAALSRYVENEKLYFKSLQCVLRLNSLLYLDILEKYFNILKFESLSPAATRYIMKNHKERFKAKIELYTSYILHLKTLANFLTAKEAKDLVLQLAKAEYLSTWFSYQNVEPLIKRLGQDERAAFKKQIFVDKAIGDKIEDWPYPIPITFELETNTISNRNIFLDEEHSSDEDICPYLDIAMQCRAECYFEDDCCRKTPLDILFERYRFKGFETTFQELSKKLLTESTMEGRMNILLVLVSKSGGAADQVNKLLKLLLEKHINEPCNVRAAVVRSLVKRACVWRLANESWTMLLKFGRDLGLEGHHAELLCIEGLHAVVLRNLINNMPLSTILKTAFLNEISTLKEYKLSREERVIVGARLAKMLLDCKPNIVLDILVEYKLKINDIPDAEITLVKMARTDSELTRRMFQCRIGRRYLLRESFKLINNNETFINALKHDTSVLESGKCFAALVTDKRPRHDRFLQTLALYFNEPNGLADQHKASLIQAMKINPQPRFARTINILSTNTSLLDLLTEIADMEIKEVNKSQLSASFRATAHKCRPMLDIMSVDWRWLGAKAVANKVLVSRQKDRDFYINLLLQWRKTARIAIRLGLTAKSSTETFISASKLRPLVALKIANKIYLKNKTIDPLVWEVIRKLIEDLVPEKTNKFLLDQLKNNNSIPENIKAEYWQTVYKVFIKIDKNKVTSILCKLENIQPSVDNNFIRNVIDTFINEKLTDYIANTDKHTYIRIIAKHLLTCTSEEEQRERLDNICNPFFDKIEAYKETLKDNENICDLYESIREFIQALKYNKVFLNDYVSSLPVFERVLQRMKKLFPIEQCFALYVEMHLIMLYYKSLKYSIKEKPMMFKNLDQNLEEAIETVGLQLGRNIGLEIKELTEEYYFSIIDIYKKVLVNFLDGFYRYYRENAVLEPVLKGLLEIGQTESLLLAQFVASKREYLLPDSYRKKIFKDLIELNNENINFFLYAYNTQECF